MMPLHVYTHTYLLDNGENPGFGIIITVGTDALIDKSQSVGQQNTVGLHRSNVGCPNQVNLVGALIGSEGCHKPKERVFRCLGHYIRGEVCCGRHAGLEMAGYAIETRNGGGG